MWRVTTSVSCELYVFVDRETNGGIVKYKIWGYPGAGM